MKPVTVSAAGFDPETPRSPLNSPAPKRVGRTDYVVGARQVALFRQARGCSMKPIPLHGCR
jgi:hypothetical protein